MQPCNPIVERSKILKDGPGPRGVPDCYYTSRVLQSTFHYVRFVKKLRAIEEEVRRGVENNKKEQKDKEFLEFFSRCDRRNLVNEVQRRVNLCLESIEQDLNLKRNRLRELFSREEETFVRQLIVDAQAGAEAIYQDNKARLAYLLAKRKKEHEEKYKDLPLDKCTHIHPCIIKIRAKEAEEIQLYQMREKKMRKMAEAELDQMWYEVAMKESDALAARMEIDAMERLRRNKDCMDNCDMQLEQRRLQHERDQERLKQEMLELRAQIDEEDRKEAEKQRLIKEKRDANSQATEQMMQDRNEAKAKANAADKNIEDCWQSLAGQSLASDKAKIARQRQKEVDLDVCNRKMSEMKNRIAQVKFNSNSMILAEGQRLRDIVDLKRCQIRMEDKRQKKLTQEFILKQIKDKEEDVVDKVEGRKENAEYQGQIIKQLDELVKHKQITDAQAKKLHQQDLLDQIKYNQLLKDQAKQEESEQIKKGEIAREEYQQDIVTMLSRPSFSDDTHPFMKQMRQGLKMRWCPCTKEKYCAHPHEPPKNK